VLHDVAKDFLGSLVSVGVTRALVVVLVQDVLFDA
jgi:hypothetical protein